MDTPIHNLTFLPVSCLSLVTTFSHPTLCLSLSISCQILICSLFDFCSSSKFFFFLGPTGQVSSLKLLKTMSKNSNKTGLEVMERLRFLASLPFASTEQTEGDGSTPSRLSIYLENLHALGFKEVSCGFLHKPITPLNMLNITANMLWS